jgi:hypothetical protein
MFDYKRHHNLYGDSSDTWGAVTLLLESGMKSLHLLNSPC